MATRTHLEGWNAGARQRSVPATGDDGEPTVTEIWEMVFIEAHTGNRIVFSMNREVRDELIKQLTGGLVLAGGEFPKI